jgi:hypothetical protein
MMGFNELADKVLDFLRRSPEGQSDFPFPGGVRFGMRDLACDLKIFVFHVAERHHHPIGYRAAEYLDGQSLLAGVGDATEAKVQRMALRIQ